MKKLFLPAKTSILDINKNKIFPPINVNNYDLKASIFYKDIIYKVFSSIAISAENMVGHLKV